MNFYPSLDQFQFGGSHRSFYNISVNLQPSQAALAPSTGWSIGSIWQSALSAAVAFAQALATVLVWLVVFSVYIIPVAFIVWFVRRWRRAQVQRAVPADTPAARRKHEIPCQVNSFPRQWSVSRQARKRDGVSIHEPQGAKAVTGSAGNPPVGDLIRDHLIEAKKIPQLIPPAILQPYGSLGRTARTGRA